MAPPLADSVIHTKMSRNKKVRCRRMSTPNKRPIGMDQLFITASHQRLCMLRERWHLTVSDFEQLEQKEGVLSLKDMARLDGKII